MSYTATVYSCSECNFSSGKGFTIHEYLGIPEREPLIRTVWCKECDAITNGVFPYLEAHTNPTVCENIDYIKFLKSSFFYRFSTKKKKEVAELEEVIEIEQAAMEARIDYFKEQPFQGKCLSCGSHQIHPLKPFSNYSTHYFSLSEEPPEPTGVTHSCGGEILVALGARFNFGNDYPPPAFAYDENGEIIKISN